MVSQEQLCTCTDETRATESIRKEFYQRLSPRERKWTSHVSSKDRMRKGSSPLNKENQEKKLFFSFLSWVSITSLFHVLFHYSLFIFDTDNEKSVTRLEHSLLCLYHFSLSYISRTEESKLRETHTTRSNDIHSNNCIFPWNTRDSSDSRLQRKWKEYITCFVIPRKRLPLKWKTGNNSIQFQSIQA